MIVEEDLVNVWQGLIETYAEQLAMGILIQDGQDILFSYQAEKLFPAASTIKLGIALYVAEHEVDTSKTVTLKTRVAGAGVLHLLTEKSTWQIAELVQLMLSVSDNTAANALIDYYGMSTMQSWLHHRYPSANVQRYFMDFHSDKQNTLSAHDATRMIADIFKPKTGSNQHVYDLMKDSLANQQFREGIFASVTEKDIPQLQLYNKNGTLDGIYHDVGRIVYQERNYNFAIFTEQNTNSQPMIGQQFLQQFGTAFFVKILS